MRPNRAASPGPLRLAALIAALAMAPMGAAEAGTVSDCVALNAAGLDFGGLDPLDPFPEEDAYELRVRCHTEGLPPFTAFLEAPAPDGFTLRHAMEPGASVFFGLFLDPARSRPLSDGVQGERAAIDLSPTGIPGEAEGSIWLYWRVPQQRGALVGPYADTVVFSFSDE